MVLEMFTLRSEGGEKMRELWRNEEGLTTVEYALLLALIFVCAIAAWQGLGSTTENAVVETTTPPASP